MDFDFSHAWQGMNDQQKTNLYIYVPVNLSHMKAIAFELQRNI